MFDVQRSTFNADAWWPLLSRDFMPPLNSSSINFPRVRNDSSIGGFLVYTTPMGSSGAHSQRLQKEYDEQMQKLSHRLIMMLIPRPVATLANGLGHCTTWQVIIEGLSLKPV
jgi:hypothetical protein